jgi:ornithine carbamoyltransferase
MIFQKRSASTETGVALLGGHSLFLGPSDILLGVNGDTACVLTVSRFNDLVFARDFGHADVVALAEHATVPVITALSDRHCPLQMLSDLMMLQEHFGRDNALAGKTEAPSAGEICWLPSG